MEIESSSSPTNNSNYPEIHEEVLRLSNNVVSFNEASQENPRNEISNQIANPSEIIESSVIPVSTTTNTLPQQQTHTYTTPRNNTNPATQRRAVLRYPIFLRMLR